MQIRLLFLLRIFLALSDLIVLSFCLLLGYTITVKLGADIGVSFLFHNIFTSCFIWLLSTSVFRLYSEDVICKFESVYRATYKSVLFYAFFFLFYLVFNYQVQFLRLFTVLFFGFTIVGFLLSRFTATSLEGFIHRNFAVKTPVAVLGTNPAGKLLATYLEKQTYYNFYGFLQEDGFAVGENGELLPAASNQLATAASSGVKEVYVSLTPEKLGSVNHLLKEAESYCIKLKFVPDMSYTASPFSIKHMGGFPIISHREEPLEHISNRFKKRLFDMLFSSMVILFVLSWLYPILALIIKLQSPGPVLFKQLRTGRDNKEFYCLKFRSMHMNNPDDKKQATRNDPRVTPIGRFIRKTSIDELPQFINVLLGHMSTVGPRPHMLKHTEEYRKSIDKYMVRQFIKPGITGWAQVNGLRGETRESTLMQKRVIHDIWYMENWSLMLDVRIIFLTIMNVFKGEENAF